MAKLKFNLRSGIPNAANIENVMYNRVIINEREYETCRSVSSQSYHTYGEVRRVPVDTPDAV